MTRFKVPENNTIQELEEQTSKFWKENKIFEKSVDQRSEEDLYVFYDGPPFISGLPHYGHLLSSIAKDLIPRYWTMRGKRVERVWGWDAHGLTVENKVQKKLDIKRRRDIVNYGLDKFTQECYKYTTAISSEWGWYVDKIGRWVDMDHAYRTIDQAYMESVIWVFKSLYDKGLVYEGVRTSLYCTTCGTPVSNFEVAMDNTYKDVEDPSITVKFKLKNQENTYVLAWTTTPWTLPSNRALVLDEDADYVKVEHKGVNYILAKERLDVVFNSLEYKVLDTFKGKTVVGLEYEPIFTFYAGKEGEFKIYSFKGMANMEEGTGIVHAAPGFGEVDTQMGQHYGLTTMLTIDDEGKFLPGNNGENPYAGIYYSKANDLIRKDLTDREILFKDERIVHRFPYHDRCDTLLIQRSQNSWFINVKDMKPALYANNENINWIPSHLKHGRFEKGIEAAPDWCISRNRFWATPMPVWQAADGSRIVIGSIKELEELSGQKVKDLHRPYIDEIVINKDGKTYKRIEEVLDSWFEAGSMPYGQTHYPFEDQKKFERNFPGDFIVEYIPQTRAWFYVMHVLSTALFNKNSFKNVIGHGTIAGNDGRKMSKTYGNYTDPKEVLEKIGGDATRLYFMSSPLMIGENANFDVDEIKTMLRNVLNPLWNSLKFFTIYAEQFDWDANKSVVSTNILDKWIVARLHQTVKTISTNVENYQVAVAMESIVTFVDDLSRWYVRRSRERLSAGDNEALSTLYEVLNVFSKAAAPAIPFLTEQIYQNLKSEELESIHLCKYPVWSEEIVNSSNDLMKNMDVVRNLVSLGHSARTTGNLAVRQPLSVLYVKTEDITKLSSEYIEILKDELNVKEIEYVEVIGHVESKDNLITQTDKNITVWLDTKISEDLELEGLFREMARKIQGLRKEANLSVNDMVVVTFEDTAKNKEVVSKYKDELLKKVSATELVAGSEFSLKRV